MTHESSGRQAAIIPRGRRLDSRAAGPICRRELQKSPVQERWRTPFNCSVAPDFTSLTIPRFHRVFPDGSRTGRLHSREQSRGDGTMLKRATRLLIIGVAAASLNISPALAQMQEIQGIVVTNKDGQLTVKTPQGDQTIALSPSARIRSVSGAFGGQKDVVPPSALIPGLPVVLEVDSSSGRAVAMDVE